MSEMWLRKKVSRAYESLSPALPFIMTDKVLLNGIRKISVVASVFFLACYEI
jgi:hypothetical protein